MLLCLFVHLVHLVHLLLLSVFSMSCVPHFAQIACFVFACITVLPFKAASKRLAFGSLQFFVYVFMCISVFLFKALSMQLAIASINFFSKQLLAPVCPGRFSPHDSSLFQPVSHHISNISNKFHQFAKY